MAESKAAWIAVLSVIKPNGFVISSPAFPVASCSVFNAAATSVVMLLAVSLLSNDLLSTFQV